jgi:hypothetical protein
VGLSGALDTARALMLWPQSTPGVCRCCRDIPARKSEAVMDVGDFVTAAGGRGLRQDGAAYNGPEMVEYRPGTKGAGRAESTLISSAASIYAYGLVGGRA